MIGTLRLTAEYLSMGFGGVLLGYGNKPGEVVSDASALNQAATFFAQSPSPARGAVIYSAARVPHGASRR